METIADQIINKLNLEVVESLDLPGRAERRLAVPQALEKGPLGLKIATWAPAGQLWRHQALALQMLFDGKNIVVGTGTASGKSLIFQLFAFDRILRDPSTKVLIFYPLKALASDQFASWRARALEFGLSEECVAKIDGDVPTSDRQLLLSIANIVLMTPDVSQAWLMRNVGTAPVRRFFDKLALLVLDEAHVYESVFGGNVAFLLRRMIAAKRRAAQQTSDKRVQIVATTATIKEPADHLSALTGRDFSVIDESENGAPFFPRRIVHVNGPEYGAGEEAALTAC
jgi:DEAD/DEAH box helicase domain-containing protein